MKIFVNPGSGPVEGGTLEHAELNMEALLEDAGLSGQNVARDTTLDGEGRFGFRVGSKGTEVEMPGWPLDRVRFLGTPDQNIWDFPRLYVDGSSWVWKFAVNIVRKRFIADAFEVGEPITALATHFGMSVEDVEQILRETKK